MMLRPQPTVTARTSRRMIPGYLLRPVMVSPVPRLRGRSVQAVSGVAAVPDQDQGSSYESDAEPTTRNKAFTYKAEMDPQQKALSSVPLAAFYGLVAAVMAGAGLVAYAAGRSLPVDPETRQITGYVAGAAAAVGVGAVGKQLKKKRDDAAITDLYNALVDMDDPTELTPENVAEVGRKYGINLLKDKLDGIKAIYGQFLQSTIPPGKGQLDGTEASRVRAFKESLSLTDEDAAEVHIEVGRRLMRDGFETKSRYAQEEQRRTFYRLIYVSALVFGDAKAAFLLPWKRVFELNDAQMFVARRDNAKVIFRAFLDAQCGGELTADGEVLSLLRAKSVEVKLMDESATEMAKETSRRYIETRLTRAIEMVKAAGKAKDMSVVTHEVDDVLAYARRMAGFAAEQEAAAAAGDELPYLVGIPGTPNVIGGPLGGSEKARDVKDLFRAYLELRLEAAGELSEAVEDDAVLLQQVLCLPEREAKNLSDEVVAKLYRKLLREEVVSGRLAAAPKPSAVLGDLVDRIRFNPEAAVELHKQLYKDKLARLLVERGRKLTDADEEELANIRRMLCLKKDDVKKAEKETTGRVFQELLTDIFMMGPKQLSDYELGRVEGGLKDLRLDTDVAMEVLSLSARERFRAYVKQAQKEQDRKEACDALKKMVQFNALVVTPVLNKVKGTDAAMKEMAKLLEQAQKDAEKEGGGAEGGAEASTTAAGAEGGGEAAAAGSKAPEAVSSAVKKAMSSSRGQYGEEERKGQKELSLKDDIDAANRAQLYKDFLIYSMSGDMVELPVGGAIRKKASAESRQADMARVSQLADVLGMSGAEVMGVQSEMMETAYKAQVQDALRTGPMTDEKAAYLEDVRSQMGLSKEQADKAVKSVKTEVFGMSAAQVEGGKWDLDRLMQVHATSPGSVESTVEEGTRRNIFRRELEKRIADGSGDLDAEWMLKKVPEVLALPQRKVDMIVKELVASRKRMLLVQAVSQYRQKRTGEVLTTLNNLISATKALPEAGPMAWTEKEEVKELFTLYCSKQPSADKREYLAGVMGISPEEAAALSAAGPTDGGAPKAAADQEDDDAFF